MTTPLGSSRLRRIIVAYTVNRLGTWFGLLALAVAVYDHTHSALAVAALLFAGEALPALVVPAVVARVEATRRRSELSTLYFFEALVTGALAILLWHFWLPAVLVLVALDGTAALTASALLRAEVARVARDQVETEPVPATPEAWTGGGPSGQPAEARAHEAERQANAALNVAFSMSFVLGPVLGGVLVAGAGAPAALLVDVGSFLLGGVLLLDVNAHVEEAGGDSVRARLSAAWRHINESASLRRVLIAEAVALLFIQSGGPIEVTFVKGTLHAGDRGLGLLLTAWGAGSVIGAIVFARLVGRPLGALLSAGTLAIAAAYFGLAAAPSLLLACVAGLVGGVGNGMQWPSLISAVQRLTPGALHGRLMGAVESLGALCLAVGLPLGGLLVALSSPRAAFVIVGVGAALAAAGFVRLAPVPLSAPGRGETAPGYEGGTGVVDPTADPSAPVGQGSLR
ncbi:MAG: transporter [Solirubrobacterales bacterium]|nr:transporter [Solirubrobacterales bacterium]